APLSWDGRSTNGAILKEVPLQYKFSPGDTVWTSGWSAFFPPDVPLGTVGESKIINGSTNNINVSLFQDFTALRYVTIVSNDGLAEIKELESGGEGRTE
ncbi:MAG: rod shape-determining protein MreC, partial [Bacteroidales bacterium]|nr:rod shape-determining protein MreC [Bacteroidales bacterium]